MLYSTNYLHLTATANTKMQNMSLTIKNMKNKIFVCNLLAHNNYVKHIAYIFKKYTFSLSKLTTATSLQYIYLNIRGVLTKFQQRSIFL